MQWPYTLGGLKPALGWSRYRYANPVPTSPLSNDKANDLFNDALATFYLRLCGVRHRVKIAREETSCRHMCYAFRLAARVILYASSHRQNNTYHGLCYTSRWALAGTRNSSIIPPWRIDPWSNALTTELPLTPILAERDRLKESQRKLL